MIRHWKNSRNTSYSSDKEEKMNSQEDSAKLLHVLHPRPASAPRRNCICCCRASKSSSPPPHLPTPTATSSLWTDGAPTWAAPSPTERHPDRTIPPSGTKLPVRGRRKPRRLHRKSRNRNPAETPHSGIRNATPQRSECHMSTFRMPHLSTSQVWHSTLVKCGIPPREVWHMILYVAYVKQKDKIKKTNRFFCSYVKAN